MLGDGTAGLATLVDIVNKTPIPVAQMLPTHMGRTFRHTWAAPHSSYARA